MIPDITIADRLRIAREKSGYDGKQAEFAELIGIGATTLIRYEKGHTRPKRIALKAWSLATGVPIEWLEFGVVPGEGNGGPAMAGAASGSGGLPQLDSNQQPAGYRPEGVVVDLASKKRRVSEKRAA